MATPTHNLNFSGVVSESKRIIKAHRRHFLVLSALFLLPLSLSSFFYRALQATFSQPNSISHNHDDDILFFLSYTTPQHLNQSLLLPVLFSLFSIFLYLCAVGTITYSTIHGFHGRPFTILSSLKSLLFSFPRLCSTFIVSQIIIMALVTFLVVVFTIFIYQALEVLGFDIDYDSKCLIWGVTLVTLALLVWIQLNWALALVVVVAESKWGYEPLRRSAYLMKGMRGVAFMIMVYFAVLMCIPMWGYWWILVVNAGGVVSVWKIFALIFLKCFLALLNLHYMVATAVLYVYCKALHGELALETVEVSAHEYVSLPFDDDIKLPHVVSVGYAQE